MQTVREQKILEAEWKRSHQHLHAVVSKDQIIIAICFTEEIAKHLLDLHNQSIQMQESVEQILIAPAELNRYKELLFSKNQNTDVRFLCGLLGKFIEVVEDDEEDPQ